MSIRALVLCAGCLLAAGAVRAQTVFTVELLRQISGTIEPDDPSAFVSIHTIADAPREVFDRRSGGTIWMFARLFEAVYERGDTLEFAVNPEFGPDEALETARRWAIRTGQWPEGLRTPVERFVLHKGNYPMAGGAGNVTVHVDWPPAESPQVEETLMHEAAHAGYQYLQRTIHWRLAQQGDGVFISAHAAQNPTSEDVAATFPAWVAVRMRPSRLTADVYDRIVSGVPNRLALLDGLGLETHPMALWTRVEEAPLRPALELAVYPNPVAGEALLRLALPSTAAVRVTWRDILGRSVHSHDSGVLSAGDHVLPQTVDLAPGMYFVQVEAGPHRAGKAVVVAR